MNLKITPLIISILTITLGCKNETQKESNVLNVRIPREPDQANPVLSTTAIAAIVENLIFMPVYDYDPYNQSSTSVLAESKPTIIKKGKSTGFTIVLRKDASWDDGTPVTADDIAFTLKCIINPFLNTSGKNGVLFPLDSIDFTTQSKQFTLWTDDDYFLDLQAFTNNYILQEKKYDSLSLLRKLSWTELKNMKGDSARTESQKIAKTFADQFTSPSFSREKVTGCGPYSITEWQTNQYIKLKRKQNWWGNKYADSIINFRQYPDEIVYRIIPEEANAVTALKDGLLDVIATDISPSMFKSMSKDSSFQNKLSFITGPSIRYVYFSLNNKSPLLADKHTRQALAHLLDLDQLANNLFQGYAQRITVPFQPSKSYYDHDLVPIAYDTSEANKLLAMAGWKDSDHNGVLDKMIFGKKNDLVLRIYVTPGGLGQQIAIHLQEQARKVGIRLELLPKPLPFILDQIQHHDFEIAALSDSQYPGPDDPYPVWHSQAYKENGQNYSGFTNATADSLIDLIRHSDPGTIQTGLYTQLEKIIYEEQPAIFLFAPKNLIIVNKKWDAKAASARPGYFVNDFKRIKI